MILVAYFSATGETARLAGTLARAAQADLSMRSGPSILYYRRSQLA